MEKKGVNFCGNSRSIGDVYIYICIYTDIDMLIKFYNDDVRIKKQVSADKRSVNEHHEIVDHNL